MMNLRVISVASSMQSFWGTSYSITGLCNHTAPLLEERLLLTQTWKGVGPLVVPNKELVETVLVEGIPPLPYFRVSFAFRFRSILRDLCQERKISLIHNHGVWTPANHAAASVAQELGIPMVISPHGMLTPWALKYKAIKKSLAWRAFQRRDIESAAVVHATADMEASELRDLGIKQPIAVIANGVEIPLFEERTPRGEPRNVLFLSRIHPKKGLLNLVSAWAELRPKKWRVIVAGEDQDGHTLEVKKAAMDLGVSADFAFPGGIYGEEKINLYRQADLFVLPTFSENFGIVVAEALACGVPAIVTKGAPWQELESEKCGWWIDIGVDPLVEALRDAMQLSDETRLEMGRNGRRLVEEKYAWPAIARQMAGVYLWMNADGEKPSCVQLY